MSNPICPVTSSPMYRGSKPMTLEYKGLKITFDMPGYYSDQSDESIHTGEDMKISDRALNQLKAQKEGLLSADEIRRIRKKLRITQVDAGLLIGGGPRAFQKYESGDLLPSRAICSALILLDQNPEGLSLLNATSVIIGQEGLNTDRKTKKRAA